MTTRAVSEALDAFLSEAHAGQGRAGVRLAVGLLDAGVPSDEVIVDLLGAAQLEVGERWEKNEWSVADEHLATGVAQKALDAVADSVELPPPSGLVVVACAPGDWHSLPAQMFAELLRSHGFAVSFLGASTPAEHVEVLLERYRPHALAVSCSLPLAFRGLMTLTEAAHRQAIPVIAGGRALGRDPHRALRLGADAWASGIIDAAPILRAWHDHPPVVTTAAMASDPLIQDLELRAPAIAADAYEALAASTPQMATYNDRQVARTREDLVFIVQFVAAARLVDDPTLLADFVSWLRGLLTARGVPASALDAGIRALIPLVAEVDRGAGRMTAALIATAG